MPNKEMAVRSPPLVNQIEKKFDTFNVTYYSLHSDDPNTGSRCFAYIDCRDGQHAVGGIKFFDRDPIPSNSYNGSHPNYVPIINFHISRFNDIIYILRYQKPLSFYFDFSTLDGALTSPVYESIGQQE